MYGHYPAITGGAGLWPGLWPVLFYHFCVARPYQSVVR